MEDVLTRLRIPPVDEHAAAQARARWNSLAKPLGSLGMLEDAVVQIAALSGGPDVDIAKRCVVVMCADNGVVEEGVSQSGSEVTTLVARHIAQGSSTICRLCAPMGIDCLAVDMGMRQPAGLAGVRDCRIALGTGNIARGPAMTRAQALQGIATGIELVETLVAQGYRLIATGEMGIGNTTTSTAMLCAWTGLAPEQLAGRGAGLSDEGLARKVMAIRRALEINRPAPDDALDVLSKLGGFDIAGLCGLFLGGALHRVPVVIDGLISSVAAYCAVQLCPACSVAMLPSHQSREPGAVVALELLGMRPPIVADMHLGEGTGAACLIPLLDMALSLYRTGATFEGYGLEPYREYLP